jgi:hypothetical protein
MTRGIALDLTGKTFGVLTVVERTSSDRAGNAMWICKCKCGNTKAVRAMFLIKRQQFCSKQCPEYIANIRLEVSGKVFGKLTAIKRVGFDNGRRAIWEFTCDCGGTIYTTLDRVNQGITKSCGCLAIASRRTRGGLSLTRAYKNGYWHAYMRQRQRATPRIPCDATVAVYAEAKRLSEETGIPHEVDHIIPLRGKLVSGLHVIANLRVVTRSENRRKSKRYDLD